MNRILLAFLVASVLANVWLVDTSVTVDQQAREIGWRGQTISALRRLAADFGRFPKRSTIELRMKESFRNDDHVIKWDGNTLWVGEVGLNFQRDSVIAIVLMNPVND